jgi:hypothetical protein
MHLLGIATLGLVSMLGFLGLWFQIQEPTVLGLTLFLGIALIPVGLVYKILIEEKLRKDFMHLILSNMEHLNSGRVIYHGIPITSDTVLRTYYFTISTGVVSMKNQTRFYIDQDDQMALCSLENSLLSLLFGWWGFPHGIIYTIQTLVKNFRGGETLSIANLIRSMNGEPGDTPNHR